MRIDEFITKVKRKETPFYQRLYAIGKYYKQLEVPYMRGLHDLLYAENRFRINAWRNFWRVVYHQPLFRSRCAECGKHLYIYHSGQGLPWIVGDPEIHFGNDVSIYDKATIVAMTMGEHPRLQIGSNTDFAQPTTFMVGREISVGSNCMIGCSLIADNPGHNMDYRKRLQRLHKILIGKVHIGDYVWAGQYSVIVGNIAVGDGAVIGANAVVTGDVPPFCVVSGNPARIVKKLPFSKTMIEEFGDATYRRYLEAEVSEYL